MRKSSSLVIAAGLLIFGCASRKPFAAWKGAVEQYVEREGHGDPNTLRLLPLARSPRELRSAPVTIGTLAPPGEGLMPFGPAQDVFGMLVDVCQVHGETWFVFIVGVVRQESGLPEPHRPPLIEDIRVAAMTRQRHDQFAWRFGLSDKTALSRYRRSREGDVASVGQDIGYAFPGPADHFALALEENWIRVTEGRSGATWRLVLDGDVEDSAFRSRPVSSAENLQPSLDTYGQAATCPCHPKRTSTGHNAEDARMRFSRVSEH